MHTTKDAAVDAGDIFYFTGRACRKGHITTRYTSSGNCTECMQEIAERTKIRNKAKKRIAHAKRFNDAELCAVTAPMQWHPIFEKLSQIAKGNDAALQQRIIATINGASVEWDAAAFAKAGVRFNGQYITNASSFKVGDPFAIRIGDLWWPGADLMACLRGERPTVTPCNYIPQVSE